MSRGLGDVYKRQQLYDGDAGYHDQDLDVPGPRHRTYMINEQLQYQREPGDRS